MQSRNIIDWVEETLYPQLKAAYTLRKAHHETAWYLSPRTDTRRVYGLVWEKDGWRLNSINGIEVERAQIEKDLQQLWEEQQ
jgi:hypothetical protein